MRAGAAALAAFALAATLTGCGSGATTPAEAVPTLATRLAQVDVKLAAHHYVHARSLLNAIIADADAARESGDLDAAAADRVIAAASRTLQALPVVKATPTPTPTSSPTATSTTKTSAEPKPEPKPEPKKGRGKKGRDK